MTTDQSREEFEAWWRSEGYKHLPAHDQPPQHGYVAGFAFDAGWQAARQAATPAPEPQGVRLSDEAGLLVSAVRDFEKHSDVSGDPVGGCGECLKLFDRLIAQANVVERVLAASPATVRVEGRDELADYLIAYVEAPSESRHREMFAAVRRYKTSGESCSKYYLSEGGPTMGHWMCACGADLGDAPIDEIEEVFNRHKPSPATVAGADTFSKNLDARWTAEFTGLQARLTTLLTELRGLRELSEKATAGEWKPDAYHNILSGEINVASTWYTGGRPAKENAAFIVACVNFVRDTLVRTVEGE